MFLALREIRRSALRFALLTGAVGLLVFLVLFQQMLLRGLVTDFVGALDHQSADVVVFGEQARKNVAGSLVFPEQAAAVAAVDGVGEVGPIGQATFTMVAGGEQVDGTVFGYELGGPGEPTTMSAGRLPEAPGEVVASAADAPDGFDVGDEIAVLPGGTVLTVVGVGEQLRWSVTPTLFTSWETFASIERANEPGAQAVLPAVLGVEPAPGVDAATLAARITAEVDGVEALTRAQAVAQSPGVESVRNSFSIVLLLAFVVITLVVGFFFLILTVQKARPMTLLRAVGAPAGYLVRNLVGQVVLVTVGGSAVALALLALAVVAGPTGGLELDVSGRTIGATVAAIVVLAVLASLVAVRRLLRIDPAAATGETGGAR